MCAVDPLQRTCTELLFDEDNGAARPRPESAPVVTVRELAEVPVFVLLGEPGMGKSETMKALARLVLGEQGQPITANDFIVLPVSSHNADRPAFIDALDEARAGGDTTVWRELRKTIAHCGLTRFGVSCRIADWQGTDAQDLATVAHGQRIRVFALDPLTPEQRHAVLNSEDIEDVDQFETKAQALGFSDMLGNPQSLKLLVAAVKKNQGQWPQTRREAFELACQELVREPNQRHRQAQRSVALLSEEHLLDAAGWLCALMLLSNQNEVADEALAMDDQSGAPLSEVLDALPADGCSTDAIRQVLQRRVFIKPGGYSATHRTVAEYLAARYIAKRIRQGGLLPARVAALMLASPQHLVSNLRGLAGWLASLSEPVRGPLFSADPAAVLDYGDLSLLPQLDKQTLIERLSAHPGTANLSNIWHKSSLYAPLVQADMQGFVATWLAELQSEHPTSSSQTTTAYVLLDALHHVSKDERWVAPLLELIRNTAMYIGVRDQALGALIVHAPTITSLALLEELQLGRLQDPDGRLTGDLLRHLYPEHVRPAQVLRFLSIPVTTRQSTDFRLFWDHDIAKLTPPKLLPELMDAMAHTFHAKAVADLARSATGHRLSGLATLAVDAITLHGKAIGVGSLASWIQVCTDHQRSPFDHLSQELQTRLAQWLKANPDLVISVLAHWMREGEKSWMAQNRIPVAGQPDDLGAFWLDQAKHWDANQEAARASDCLQAAFGRLDQGDRSISLEDLEQAAARSATLQEALSPLLSSALDDDNWRRERWLHERTFREAEAAKEAVREQDRRYLLDHLNEVRQGDLLNYLSDAAWVDMRDHGYLGGSDSVRLVHWRERHPELDAATREGYRALLDQLTSALADTAVKSRQQQQLLDIELPCLLAAQQLYSEQADDFFRLGEERLKALTTLYLLNHSGQHDWFLALVKRHPDWVEDIWWALCKRRLRSKKQLLVPHMDLLRRELAGTPIAVRLLSQSLAAWPSKFAERDFSEFAELLEVTLRQCPAAELSRLIQTQLRRRSLGSRQKAYLLMAGLWIDHLAFAPKVQQGLTRKQIAGTELLGYVGHLHRYGDRSQPLPAWDAGTLDLLFRLFAPLCSPAYPVGAYSPGIKDAGRDFLYQVLASFRNNTSESAQHMLAALRLEPSLSEWKLQLEEVAFRQAQARAEKAFAVPTPRQVALTFQNKAPANPSDLMAVAQDALGELQREIRNNPVNQINSFWSVDPNGKHPRPPHKPENACRDVIAQWLIPRLSAMSVTVLPELLHGAQKRADLGLLVHQTGAPEMLLPIEVKGDWHPDLWTAAHRQLGEQYANDSRCGNQGIYLVLWLGKNRGTENKPKSHPNHPTPTPADLQRRLQSEVNQNAIGQRIQVFVLDISIPD